MKFLWQERIYRKARNKFSFLFLLPLSSEGASDQVLNLKLTQRLFFTCDLQIWLSVILFWIQNFRYFLFPTELCKIISSLFRDSICIFCRNIFQSIDIFQSIIKYRIAQLSRFPPWESTPAYFVEGNVLIHQTHLSGWSANKLILACRVYTRLVREFSPRILDTVSPPINTDSYGYRSPWRGRQKVDVHCKRNGSACGVRWIETSGDWSKIEATLSTMFIMAKLRPSCFRDTNIYNVVDDRW